MSYLFWVSFVAYGFLTLVGPASTKWEKVKAAPLLVMLFVVGQFIFGLPFS